MVATVTVNDVLDGHVGLDIECLARIYLNGYVPNLQMGGQVVSFLTQHLGNPIPSPAILEKIGTAFRRAVASFAEDNHIPVVRFNKGIVKLLTLVWCCQDWSLWRSRQGTRVTGIQSRSSGTRCGYIAVLR
jgi:hypothetical protein